MERQRRRRTVRLFWSDNPETGILSSRVGPVSFGQVRQALDKHADLLRREDSGGEIRPDDIRANDQRRADALVELITGRRARTLEPLPDRRVGESPAQLVVVVADWGQDRRVPSRWGVRNTGHRARPALGSGPPFARLFRVRDHLRGQRPRVAAGTQPATGQRGPTPGRPRCGTGGACGATPPFTPTELAPPAGLVRRRPRRHRQPGFPVRPPPPGDRGTQPGIGKNLETGGKPAPPPPPPRAFRPPPAPRPPDGRRAPTRARRRESHGAPRALWGRPGWV